MNQKLHQISLIPGTFLIKIFCRIQWWQNFFDPTYSSGAIFIYQRHVDVKNGIFENCLFHKKMISDLIICRNLMKFWVHVTNRPLYHIYYGIFDISNFWPFFAWAAILFLLKISKLHNFWTMQPRAMKFKIFPPIYEMFKTAKFQKNRTSGSGDMDVLWPFLP